MKYLRPPHPGVVHLDVRGHRRVHVFDDRSVLAVNGALAANRPLLIRGEPGVGKSQLAMAAAWCLGRAYVSTVVDARTESRDLHYSLDTIERLAKAQVAGALKEAADIDVRAMLDESAFVRPGPLWWAFDFESAREQADSVGALAPWRPGGWHPIDGVVFLIDEIDKADSSVPNGLLEALGNGEFTVPGQRIVRQGSTQPLVIITTNEERALPDAFLRRCMVLQLSLPTDTEELVSFLIARGRAHFPDCDDELLEQAAELLANDRQMWSARGLVPPGQAEYLDLLRALTELSQDADEQSDLLQQLAQFVFRKHPEGEL